jgi:hypothetical protein
VNPLLRELVRAWRLAETPVLKPILDRVGLTEPPHHWGVDWVEVDGGLYRPADGGGRVALIVGVKQHGGTIDLLATSLETRAMRRRNGLATLLGEESLDYALQYGRSLAVFADAVSWIANGRKGVVILDWKDAPLQLSEVPSLVCETEALRDRIRRAFADSICSSPPTFVPDNQAEESHHAV